MDASLYFIELALAVVVWVIFWLGPFLGILWLGYYLLSLRLRRQERARFFLDLVETGLNQGRRLEDTIISVSNARDGSLGVHFHLLAYHLKEGLAIREALAKVPQVLPPQIAAMLRAGLQIGDVGKVLPACRQLSRDAVSQTRGAINYLVLMAFIGFPVNLVLLTILQIKVLPQFFLVASGMEIALPTGLLFLIQYWWLIFAIQFVLFVFVWCAALVYMDGPRLFGWLDRGLAPVTQRVSYSLPWRRKRMQRDFSAMLAILIDAGMPEAEALSAAADCTANQIFRERTRVAADRLRGGMKLTEAVQLVDDTGEFRWRLATAMQAPGGFFRAIAGWNESLDAKAFEQEQATAQVVTTGIVLLNGFIVGFIVVSIFSVLIAIINEGTLW
jgi:type II secretory pathway component PulF